MLSYEYHPRAPTTESAQRKTVEPNRAKLATPMVSKSLANLPKYAGSPIDRQHPVQRIIRIKGRGEYETRTGAATTELINDMKADPLLTFGRGWMGYVRIVAGGKTDYTFPDTASFYAFIRKKNPVKDSVAGKRKKTRPGFPSASDRLGKVTLGLQTGKDQSKFSPSGNDAALPHRFPYAAIQQRTKGFLATGDEATLIRWSDRLKRATEQRRNLNAAKLKGKTKSSYVKDVNLQITKLELARGFLAAAVKSGEKLNLLSGKTQAFLKAANGMHGNIPDYGPHSTVNVPVSDRLHMHFESGRLTPGSIAAGSMTPDSERGVAVTEDGDHIVTTDGLAIPLKSIHPDDLKIIKRHSLDKTSLSKKSLLGHNWKNKAVLADKVAKKKLPGKVKIKKFLK